MSNRTITEQELRDELEFYQELLERYQAYGGTLKIKVQAKIELLKDLISQLWG